MMAALAWAFTAKQSRAMDFRAGTVGMALPMFLVMWVAMMTAMMLPSVAPVAILWARTISGNRGATASQRGLRMGQFVFGYLAAWTGYGLLAFAMLIGAGALVQTLPDGGLWFGSALLGMAGLYQFTPLKDVCLRHCRSPLGQLVQYGAYKGVARDLRVGLHHGAYCVGCCWGLMVVLIAVGVMNVPAMAALAAVIFLEKLWRRGVLLTKAAGAALLLLAALAPFHPWLVQGVLLPR